jgi:DNA-3-methyladenine glycosylase
MNVSTGAKGVGEAVLFRAAQPLLGVDTMRRYRELDPNHFKTTDLLSGPGKMTRGLGIGPEFNGVRFDRDDFKLVDLGERLPNKMVGRSPRIGISQAREEAYRFYLRGSLWLSRKDKDAAVLRAHAG